MANFTLDLCLYFTLEAFFSSFSFIIQVKRWFFLNQEMNYNWIEFRSLKMSGVVSHFIDLFLVGIIINLGFFVEKVTTDL